VHGVNLPPGAPTDRSRVAQETRAMARDWSSLDQRQVGRAMNALLSPIAYESGTSAGHFSADAPELAKTIESITISRRGELHFSDEVVEAGMIGRRRRSMAVFTS